MKGGRRVCSVAVLSVALAAVSAIGATSQRADGQAVRVTLNGLEVSIDSATGSITRLSYPGPGTMLETDPGDAGLVDLAYPRGDFDALRLASRYSREVEIGQRPDEVTIRWSRLGASRPFELPGRVAAQIRLVAMPDGRSVRLTCEIENQSDIAVCQVLFPDLIGLVAFQGQAGTEFRTCGLVIKPFQTLRPRLDAGFYPVDGVDAVEYTGGSAFTPMVGRWADLGGLAGGISLFPQVWSGAPNTKVRLHRTETHGTLRLSFVDDVTVAPGETWQSPAYVLTPHQHGWAKGIEPYREWVRANVHRVAPMPDHVRRGLGYRTIWMCRGYPADAQQDAAFRFSDLPKVAAESKAHGLNELVVWLWQAPFQLPDAPPYEHLGTPEQLAAAIKECRLLGVNVSLFVSWMSISEPTAGRYGLTVPPGGWNYHPEMIPRFNPAYARQRATAGAVLSDPRWRKDVLDSARHIIEQFTPSICWDQVLGDPRSGELYTLFDGIREVARRADPQSTFSGESVVSIEKDADYLDYTWNWQDYKDLRPFTNAFPAPRLNANVNRDASAIPRAFMDNLYINVMPARPDDANATAYIERYPELSRALKQCAKLREQFLTYFVDGTLIGDGLLGAPLPTSHVTAYVLPDRALMLVMNEGDGQALDIRCDLTPWLPSPSGRYMVRSYRMDGTPIAPDASTGPIWTGRTHKLARFDLALFEFQAK